MKEYQYVDKLHPRGRHSWLLLIAGGKVHVFSGENIPGVAVVVGEDYETKGKWSSTTYKLALADSVRPIAGANGWETGRFLEGLASATCALHIDRWVDVADALCVDLEEAQRFLHEYKPEEAELLDAVETALQELHDGEPATTLVVTRHPALVQYLLEQGIIKDGAYQVLTHATVEDVRGKDVIGVLPLALAAEAATVTEVPLNVPADKRGQELTLEQVREYAQPVSVYHVTKLR